MKKQLAISAFFFASLSGGAAYAEDKWELRMVDGSAPGGYVSLGTYDTSKNCAKARNRAERSNPRRSIGCMRVPG